MARYIDAELAVKQKSEGLNAVYDLTDLEDYLAGIPTADVVEVVRCKDCKHWNNGDCYRLELSLPSDFCSYGERSD